VMFMFVISFILGGINAQDVAYGLIDSGYDGCWVLVFGINDVVDVYVGLFVSLFMWIDKMMLVVGD